MSQLFKDALWVLAIAFMVYGITYLDYLANKSHIESLIASGMALRLSDKVLLWYGTFQWWAVLLSIICGVLVILIYKLSN